MVFLGRRLALPDVSLQGWYHCGSVSSASNCSAQVLSAADHSRVPLTGETDYSALLTDTDGSSDILPPEIKGASRS